MSRIAIVGSGLSALALARTLVARGVKPTVLDYGTTLQAKRQAVVERMSSTRPNQWSLEDRKFVSDNATVHGRGTLPRKLAFGSDYFYADSLDQAETETDGVPLPHSYAKGGFSVGWGSSVLPPDDCDLRDWPLQRSDLETYFRRVLAQLPYSARDDGLSRHFPVYASHGKLLRSTGGCDDLLQRMNSVPEFGNEFVAFGRARLLVRAEDDGTHPGCRYCGLCMSGCVYGCIHKSDQDLEAMLAAGQIDYEPGVLVHETSEVDGKVDVVLSRAGAAREVVSFDRVFLAAGAVGSTRIVLQSKRIHGREIRLLSTAGFVAPLFRLNRAKLQWPEVNTLPGLFLEFKVKDLSDHWVHTQIGTPNELVLEKLGVKWKAGGIVGRLKKRIAEHLIVAQCNLHSDHANGYFLKIEQNRGDRYGRLVSRREDGGVAVPAVRKTARTMLAIARRIGCYSMMPLLQNSLRSGGFHLGGTLPMRKNPQEETDTNLLGNPRGWRRTHVVDSSIFPSLPGTTIGLLAMANAARIGAETRLD